MAKHIFSGTGAPATTPQGIGHHYIDTTNKIAYISVGTSSAADWETSDAAAVESLLDDHIADVANPHSVTKSQVGLGNADNTSDLDKPISTATQTALDLKVDENAPITGATKTKISYDAKGLVTAGADIEATDLPSGIDAAKLADGSVSNTEFQYLNGVTSAIQTQLGAKKDDSMSTNKLLGRGTAGTGVIEEITLGTGLTLTGTTLDAAGGGGGTWGSITGTLSDQTDLQGALDAKQDEITGSNSQLVWKDGGGAVETNPAIEFGVNSEGLHQQVTYNPDNASQNRSIMSDFANIDPISNSPDDSVNILSLSANVDTQSDGFTFGTSGNAVRMLNNNFNHDGTSNIGEVNFLNNYFDLGNGTDAINVRGFSYSYGFGDVRANATINGPMQGYGYQPNFNASSFIDSGQYTQAFYDSGNVPVASPNWTSFNSSPQISSILNNNNFTGVNVNPNIPTFTGNAGVTAVNIAGIYGTFNAGGYFNGLNVNPTISSGRYVAGINVTMDNVTLYPGVQSTLTEQDLTFTWITPGNNNGYSLEYTAGGTAGSESVSITGQAIEVQIEDGVSTATQIKAAMDAIPGIASNISITISGTGSNPQDIFGPTNFTGGIDPGSKRAAYLDGDVEITGSLSFGGALSIGKLNAFASEAIVSGSGNPASIHSLITNPTVAANATITNGDTLGINTAMLLTMGDNSTVTTGFTGLSALALPAVVKMGSGATVDLVAGATFAVSLDLTAGGGTIASLPLCRSVAIPNGVTSITRLFGYKFDLPFGDPGTTSWGFYETPGANNYFAGNILIGGTAGSDDTVTNSSVALEIKSTTKAFICSRMDSTQEGALTAVNGMIIYNTTTNKFRGYENGSWVNLV